MLQLHDFNSIFTRSTGFTLQISPSPLEADT